MPRILVIDDDRETCRLMRELLQEPEREIETVQTPDEALSLLERSSIDLVVSDIHLDASLTGIDMLRAFKARDSSVEVVLISAFGTLETALDAVRAGAFDYVSKPVDIAQLRDVVGRALARRARAGEIPAPFLPDKTAPDGLVGRSAGMLSVYKQIALACASDAPVLVTGETGTGKELVARAIHRHGSRSARAFVPVNCGSLPEGLLESELFGHSRGAFTGAVADKRGLVEQANGGTLFLDEVGEMSAALQVRLLRTIEQGEVRPLGAERILKVDTRIIAATHRDLERAVADGTFRQDLFYRLNVFAVRVPPLRERREDIPLLVTHFLGGLAARGRHSPSFTPAALAALSAHAWPGNVRELENVLERLVVEARGATIDVPDLPPSLREARAPLETGLFAGLPSLEELEKRYLRHVLAEVKGNRSRAAEVLGIDRRTLYRMAERFSIDLGEEESRRD
jgi:DNA-binding NtrC family response regulator